MVDYLYVYLLATTQEVVAILVKNQKIKIKWNNTNKEWYINKGYNFTKRFDELYVDAEDLTPSSGQKVKVICDYCGKEYETQYATRRKGYEIFPKDACSHCASKKTYDVTREKYAHEYFDKVKEVCEQNGYILVSSEDDYVDARTRIKYICPKHGMQESNIDNLSRGHGCISCAYEKKGINLRFTKSEILDMVESVGVSKLLNVDEYKDIMTHNLQFQCECGNIFTTSLANYYKHGITRCGSCSSKTSSGEYIISKFLKTKNIHFETEKRFSDCRDIKPLPFDFYIPSLNTLIEFDGKQHFEEVEIMNHERTVKHDEIKNNYCAEHNINLIRIPYWKGHDIENILSNKLNI